MNEHKITVLAKILSILWILWMSVHLSVWFYQNIWLSKEKYVYQNLIRNLHDLDVDDIVREIEISDRPVPQISISVFLEKGAIPKSRIMTLSQRYKKSCDVFLTAENPECRGNYNNVYLDFKYEKTPRQKESVFTLQRYTNYHSTADKKGEFVWSVVQDNFQEYRNTILE
ncbi:MAG: hypothetical protein Q4A78_02100 [Peptostreptococcaceae bacterium]|nr:hypothetical protein [Peptostreptococcaceae bacterium]